MLGMSRARLRRAGMIAAMSLASAACADDDTLTTPEPPGFQQIQTILAANDCRSCHNATNTLFYGVLALPGTREGDSTALDGFMDFENPEQSALFLRLLKGSQLTHPLKLWNSATEPEAAMVIAYMQALGTAGRSHDLIARPTTNVPTVDGIADAAWANAAPLVVRIDGGFAGSVDVSMRAMYTTDRLFMLVEWADPTESVERAPWVRTATGWLRTTAAPYGFNNALLPLWRQPPANYLYEDKLSIIWNTVGPSAVAGFNEAGCAVLCHAAALPRPLKYTNRLGETADMWHWKLVRTNVVHRLDDQYVYWNRDVAVAASGGRAGDPGGSEYASNSTLITLAGGAQVPQYTSNNQPGRYYVVDAATAAQWAATNPGWTIDPNDIARVSTADYPEGTHLAYVITTLKPNVDRSDVEAYAVWSSGRWTIEISRKLNTGSAGAIPTGGTSVVPVDVQFQPGGTYHFGVAVFENAQIEHSWSPGVYRMRLVP